MSQSDSPKDAVLILPPPGEQSAQLLNLVHGLSTLDLMIILPDDDTFHFSGINSDVVPLTSWIGRHFRQPVPSPVEAVINGLNKTNEEFDDPFIQCHFVGGKGIRYVVAPLPKDPFDASDFGRFELGKFQMIMAAITTSAATIVTNPEHYAEFLARLQGEGEVAISHRKIFASVAAAQVANILAALSERHGDVVRV